MSLADLGNPPSACYLRYGEVNQIASAKTEAKEIVMPLIVGRAEDSVFGRELRERREEVGLSQAELGLIAGVHRGTIRNAETGRPLEARTLTNVLRALGCTLLGGVTGAAGDDGVMADPGLRDVLSVGLTRTITRAILEWPDDHESFEKIVTDYFEVVSAAAEAIDDTEQAGRSYEAARVALVSQSAAMNDHRTKFGIGTAEYEELSRRSAEAYARMEDAQRVLKSRWRIRDIPVSVERLRIALVGVLPVHQIRDFDGELRRILGEKYPIHWTESGEWSAPSDRAAPTVDLAAGSGKSATLVAGLGRGLGALIPKTPVLSDMQLIVESELPDDVKQQLMDHMSRRRSETEEMLQRELALLIEQIGRMPQAKDLR